MVRINSMFNVKDDADAQQVKQMARQLIEQSRLEEGNLSYDLFQGSTPTCLSFCETWLDNDGLVNTISATAPFNEPSVDFDENNIAAGVWNVMPVYEGDHMSLQGGMLVKNDVRDFYAEHLEMINSL